MLDVTIRYENKNFLAAATTEKIEKYSPILKHLSNVLGAGKARVVPIVLGSRGAVPAATWRELKQISFSRRECENLSTMVLSDSVELVNHFMDG